MSEMMKVGIADLKTCKAPDGVMTLGLGSCVGIAIRDPAIKIGGLVHIMLPDSTQISNNSNIPKFADTGITELVRQMVAKGAKQSWCCSWREWEPGASAWLRRLPGVPPCLISRAPVLWGRWEKGTRRL